MPNTATEVNEFPRDERGATATEYALIVSFIALAIILGVTAFGINLNDFYDRLAEGITDLVNLVQ